MALAVEDGTGVENADSYASREDFIAFAAKRGVVVPDEDKTDTFAILAMDFLAIQCWQGVLAYPGEQYVNWPRRELIAGDTAEDAVLEIPHNIVQAQLHLWLAAFNGIELVPARKAEPKLKKRKTGPLEREYFEQSDFFPDLPMVAALLAPLQCGQGFRLRTYRA